jgi:hypothetical protein
VFHPLNDSAVNTLYRRKLKVNADADDNGFCEEEAK